MGNAQAKVQLAFQRIVAIIGVLILLFILYLMFVNWGFIKYKLTRQFETKRFGITWRTNLLKACSVGQQHNRQLMIVYIDSRANDAGSKRLIENIMPTDLFKSMANTYIPVLCDMQQGIDITSTEKANQDEIVKRYDLGRTYGIVILADSNGYERRKVVVTKENVNEVLAKLVDGKYQPLAAPPRPQFRNPLRKKAKKAAAQVQKAVTGEGQINPQRDEEEQK